MGTSTVEIVSVTSRIPDRAREPYYRYNCWHDRLTHFGFQPTILGMGEPWSGLCNKPRRLRNWLRSGDCTSDYLISSDSYDVVFGVSPQEVVDRFTSGHFDTDAICCNAERGLFPRGDLQPFFDRADHGGSPWKYLNSGLYIGKPSVILQMLELMFLDEIHDDYQRPDGSYCHVNDQAIYQTAWVLQEGRINLDYNCELFQCGSACTIDEFDLSGSHVRNIVTGTEPLVFHFNGGSKNSPEEGGIMHPMLRKWGMEHYL